VWGPVPFFFLSFPLYSSLLFFFYLFLLSSLPPFPFSSFIFPFLSTFSPFFFFLSLLFVFFFLFSYLSYTFKTGLSKINTRSFWTTLICYKNKLTSQILYNTYVFLKIHVLIYMLYNLVQNPLI